MSSSEFAGASCELWSAPAATVWACADWAMPNAAKVNGSVARSRRDVRDIFEFLPSGVVPGGAANKPALLRFGGGVVAEAFQVQVAWMTRIAWPSIRRPKVCRVVEKRRPGQFQLRAIAAVERAYPSRSCQAGPPRRPMAPLAAMISTFMSATRLIIRRSMTLALTPKADVRSCRREMSETGGERLVRIRVCGSS